MTERKVILYAEDDDNLRKVYGLAWKRFFPEYSIEDFADGSSLERRLAEDVGNVRLVITDNRMPGITGSEIIEKYAKKDEFRHIPFILFYIGDSSIGMIAMKNGAFGYLIKGKEHVKEIADYIRQALKVSDSLYDFKSLSQ
ncbi:MAG: response regulator [Candidatus Pacearchaeota archaeon]|jgi:DNA-binding NtrC family response regulator